MTLIACLDIQGVPVLLADVIVSSPGQVDRRVGIPSRPDLTDLKQPERTITSVTRKIAKVHDRLVVGWAGTEMVARFVVKDLRVFCQERDPNRDSLFARLGAYEDFGMGVGCTLVGWLVDDRGPLAFEWDSASKRIVQGDKLYAVGTGADDLRSLLRGQM